MLTTHKLTGGAIRLGLGIGGFLHTGGGLVNSEEEHGIKRDLRLIKIPNNMVLQDAIPSDYNHYF